MADFATIEMKIQPSFYKKIDKSAVNKAKAETIKDTTLKAESECKKQAPGPGNQLPGTDYKASGRLRAGHSSDISDDEGVIHNNMNYWVYVVHGTSKMEARNYPQQICNQLASEQYMSRAFVSKLRSMGVLD